MVLEKEGDKKQRELGQRQERNYFFDFSIM